MDSNFHERAGWTELKKLHYPGDAVIYAVLIFAVVLSFAAPALMPADDALYHAVITCGDTVRRCSLSQDVTLPITTESGHTLTVQIQSGTVSVSSADCPDQICVRTAPISRPGSAIACVPAGVLIEIVGEGGTSDADIILG